MTAQMEEIVVNADIFKSQNLLPRRQNDFFFFVSRFFPPALFNIHVQENIPIDLAAAIQGHLPHLDKQRRDHVFGQGSA